MPYYSSEDENYEPSEPETEATTSSQKQKRATEAEAVRRRYDAYIDRFRHSLPRTFGMKREGPLEPAWEQAAEFEAKYVPVQAPADRKSKLEAKAKISENFADRGILDSQIDSQTWVDGLEEEDAATITISEHALNIPPSVKQEEVHSPPCQSSECTILNAMVDYLVRLNALLSEDVRKIYIERTQAINKVRGMKKELDHAVDARKALESRLASLKALIES